MKKVVYIFGSGPSINDITEEEWKYLEDKETIGFSHISFTNKKIKYYVATESFRDSIKPFKRMVKNNFMDTKVISHKDETCELSRDMGFDTTQIRVRKGLRNFNGKTWLHKNNPPGRVLDNFGKTLKDPLFTYRGQLSIMLNIAYTLNPDEIKLIGVDLNDSTHFFDDMEDCKRLRQHEEYTQKDRPSLVGWSKEIKHATAWPSTNKFGEIVTVPEIIKYLRKELEDIDIGLYVCSKDSLLCKENILEYKGIMD